MRKLIAIKIFFVLAAITFIAKPFIGFSVYTSLRKAHHKVILVKSFTKRKPEYLAEAEIKKSAIHQSLSNPPEKTAPVIALLTFLFPGLLAFKNTLAKISDRLVFYAGPKTYLLTGKLII